MPQDLTPWALGEVALILGAVMHPQGQPPRQGVQARMGSG